MLRVSVILERPSELPSNSLGSLRLRKVARYQSVRMAVRLGSRTQKRSTLFYMVEKLMRLTTRFVGGKMPLFHIFASFLIFSSWEGGLPGQQTRPREYEETL